MAAGESSGLGIMGGTVKVLSERGPEGSFGWFLETDLGSTFRVRGERYELVMGEGGRLAGLGREGRDNLHVIPFHSTVGVTEVKSPQQIAEESLRSVEAAIRALEDVAGVSRPHE